MFIMVIDAFFARTTGNGRRGSLVEAQGIFFTTYYIINVVLYIAIVLLLVIHVALVGCLFGLSSFVLAPLSGVSLRDHFSRCVARNGVDQSCVLCEIVLTNHACCAKLC